MAIPHRRPAYGVNAPALFRHIGFRIEETEENPLTATTHQQSRERRARVVTRLNLALAAIQKRCGTKENYSFSVSRDEASDQSVPITNTLLNTLEHLPDKLTGWRGRLRVDIHSEYYFVTFILDQPSGTTCVPAIGDIERDLSTTGCVAIDSKRFIQTYYEDVWESLEQYLQGGLDRLPGRRFTEFRSIALRDTESPFLKNRHEHVDKFTMPQIESLEFQAARRSMREWLTRNAPCIHEILQVDEFTKKIDQDANCVLCEVLGGAGIYGSSVRLVPGKDFQPLRYFLLYNGLSKYQLGRLVRRTHVMGELRVAAVLDSPTLNDASSRIRALGNNVDTLLNDAHGTATLNDRELDSVLQELNRINSLVPGGLMYRVNRSRYYVQSFRDRMSDMRVGRLEGWQPYDQFFQRNLYQVFDEIDRVGRRYEALSDRINRLTIARHAAQLREWQKAIRRLVDEMTAADRTILQIQELGEWIGLTAFAYYGGHILNALLRTNLKSMCPEHVGPECLPTALTPIAPLLARHDMVEVLAFAIAIGIALVLRWNWKRKWRNRASADPSRAG